MAISEERHPIFVTGTQRSGTTLLHHILGASSQIWSRNEMYAVHDLVFSKRKSSSEKELRELLRSFLGIELSDVPFEDTKQGRSHFLFRTLQAAANSAGKARWCLKDPRATYYLQDYADTSPTSKFIITIRDPRAVVRSYLDPRGFRVGRPANLLVGADRWRDEVKKQLDFVGNNPDRTIIISYESLVTDIAKEIERVAVFLNIPVEKSMLEYFNHAAEIRIHDGNSNILRPPDPTKIDAWRAEFSPQQVRLIESRTGEIMESLGYTCEHPFQSVSAIREAVSKFHHRIVHEYRWQMHKWTQK